MKQVINSVKQKAGTTTIFYEGNTVSFNVQGNRLVNQIVIKKSYGLYSIEFVKVEKRWGKVIRSLVDKLMNIYLDELYGEIEIFLNLNKEEAKP